MLALPAHAKSISDPTITSGSTLPGSSTDYIFFDPTSYEGGSIASTTDSDLNSFTVSGGYVAEASTQFSTTASISPPGGGTPVPTGDVDSSLYAPDLGQYIIGFDLTSTANTGFNYNDFNVYVMFSNQRAHQDTGILLGDSTTVTTFDYGTNNAVTDDYTTGNTAQFIEYNVQGYGSFLATPGNALVLGAEGANQTNAYVSALSFESIPEPSVFAMLLGGLGLLAFGLRFSKVRAGSRI